MDPICSNFKNDLFVVLNYLFHAMKIIVCSVEPSVRSVQCFCSQYIIICVLCLIFYAYKMVIFVLLFKNLKKTLKYYLKDIVNCDLIYYLKNRALWV